MKESKERKTGVVLSYVSIFVNTVIQLLYMPLLIKKLGNSEYGIYSLVASVIGYLAVLDLGFGDAIIMYTARYRTQKKFNKEKKLHGMFLVIFSIIGVVVSILGFILFLNVDEIFGNSMSLVEIEKMKILMLILTFNLAVTFPFSIYTSIVKAYEKFTFQKVIAITNSLLQPIIMIPLLFLGYKSITLTLVVTMLNLFVLLSNYLYCRNKLNVRIKYCGFDKKLFKEIFSYSFYIFLNIIVDRINWSTDQFVLGIFSGTAAVSLYSIASKLNEMFIKLSSAISGVLFPKISKMVASDASDLELSDEFIKTGRLQYIVIFLMCSGLVLFGKEFFILWVGNDYVNAYYVAIVLIIPLSIPLIQNLGISILQAKNIHKFRSLLYLAVAIANILISIPLAKTFGAIGAAFGTALSLIIGNVIIINIYYYKKAHLDIPRFWKEIFKMTGYFIFPILFILVLSFFVRLTGFLSFIVFGSLYTLIYFVVCYKFAMNDYEKSLVNKIIRKFYKIYK